jgi:hypothetical protein
VQAAIDSGQSGFFRILPVSSRRTGQPAYDPPSSRIVVPNRFDPPVMAGGRFGNSGFTGDQAQPADQAAGSVGPSGVE